MEMKKKIQQKGTRWRLVTDLDTEARCLHFRFALSPLGLNPLLCFMFFSFVYRDLVHDTSCV
ncbi:hypothetical protein BT69DRAFT_492607 [Atractiella rhizophila]|nr:hypothetical protein BT69DRAFT_492607 [Atractiella rhizophila]